MREPDAGPDVVLMKLTADAVPEERGGGYVFNGTMCGRAGQRQSRQRRNLACFACKVRL